MPLAVRPLSVHPLSVYTYLSCRDISVVNGKISIKLGLSTCEWALLKRFSRPEVKAQGHNGAKCTCCGGGIHFDGVASRLTCFSGFTAGYVLFVVKFLSFFLSFQLSIHVLPDFGE